MTRRGGQLLVWLGVGLLIAGLGCAVGYLTTSTMLRPETWIAIVAFGLIACGALMEGVSWVMRRSPDEGGGDEPT